MNQTSPSSNPTLSFTSCDSHLTERNDDTGYVTEARLCMAQHGMVYRHLGKRERGQISKSPATRSVTSTGRGRTPQQDEHTGQLLKPMPPEPCIRADLLRFQEWECLAETSQRKQVSVVVVVGFMPKINSLKAALICSKYSRKNPPLKGREQLRIRQDPCPHLCGGADTG